MVCSVGTGTVAEKPVPPSKRSSSWAQPSNMERRRPTERADGSVASDPQLHTHAVILNIAERKDGTWGALDGRHFYKWKMAAGALYRAHLANELRRELGVDIKVIKNGLFEVAGITKDIRDHFSSRRGEVEEALAARGLKTKNAQAPAIPVKCYSASGKQRFIQ